MRFPWLQVDLDFITAHSRDLAALLGVSRREAMGLAMDLWIWVLGRSTSAAPPDGIVRGPSAARLLAGAVDWTGGPAELLAALEGSGLVERMGDDVRVRGLSRYKATWEKNQRRHGAGPEPGRHRNGSDTAPDRKTQTQTQKKEDPPAPSGQRELIPQQAEPPRKPPKARRPSDPRHAPLVKALVEAAPGYTFGGPDGALRGAEAVAVTRLLALADAVPETTGEKAPAEILRRWRISRAHSGYPDCKSLTELATDRCWNHFATVKAPARGPAPPSSFGPPPQAFERSEFAPVDDGQPF